jgi:hypothetical protein
MAESSSFVVVFDTEGGVDLRISSGGQEQHSALLDRTIGTKLVVLGDMTDVTHGTLTKDGDPATLIVMKFQFVTGKNHRRFKTAEITATFSGVDATDTGPGVLDIAPYGTWSMLPSKTTFEEINKVNVGAQGGIPVATGNVGYEWQLKEVLEKENTARLTGAIRLLGRDNPPRNTAIWTLLENPDTEKGIPTLLHTAILLKRDKPQPPNMIEQKFKATVEVKAEVDRVSSFLEWINGKVHKDDAITFNPTLAVQGRKFDHENLEDEDLEGLQKIISMRKLES